MHGAETGVPVRIRQDHLSRRDVLREAAKAIAEEVLDPTPVELPVLGRPLTLREEMSLMVRQEVLARTAEEMGIDVPEHVVDKLDLFQVDPDQEPDWSSQYELVEMSEEIPSGSAPTGSEVRSAEIGAEGAPAPEASSEAPSPATSPVAKPLENEATLTGKS